MHVPGDTTSQIPHDWFERFMASLPESDGNKEDRFVTKEDNIKGGILSRQLKNDKKEKHQKPKLSVLTLAFIALKDSPSKRMTLDEICEYIMKKYPYYQAKINLRWKKQLSKRFSTNNFFFQIGQTFY